MDFVECTSFEIALKYLLLFCWCLTVSRHAYGVYLAYRTEDGECQFNSEKSYLGRVT